MAGPVKLHDLEFVPYISEAEIAVAVARIATLLNTAYEGRCPLFVVVLNGAFVFAADLLKHIETDCEISFMRVSSYRGTASTGEVKEMMPVGTEVVGKDVVLIEDIVDTGNTIGKVKQTMLDAGAGSVRICTLLFKPDAFQGTYRVDYIGKEIPDRFVVGYGLDYDGLGRNISCIYQIRPKT